MLKEIWTGPLIILMEACSQSGQKLSLEGKIACSMSGQTGIRSWRSHIKVSRHWQPIIGYLRYR